MSELPHPLILQWHGSERASEADLVRVEAHFGVVLPAWYRRFMIETGSGEAETADGAVVFYPVAELTAANSGNGAGFDMMAYGLFLFGSDGGGEGFAFNVRRQPAQIVMMPFISNYRNNGVVLGEGLEDLLDYANRFDYPSFDGRVTGSGDDRTS